MSDAKGEQPKPAGDNQDVQVGKVVFNMGDKTMMEIKKERFEQAQAETKRLLQIEMDKRKKAKNDGTVH